MFRLELSVHMSYWKLCLSRKEVQVSGVCFNLLFETLGNETTYSIRFNLLTMAIVKDCFQMSDILFVCNTFDFHRKCLCGIQCHVYSSKIKVEGLTVGPPRMYYGITRMYYGITR
jgi:hypothetical protein